MLISTALLLDSIIRNSVCTPAKLLCRRVEVGYEKFLFGALHYYVSFSSNYILFLFPHIRNYGYLFICTLTLTLNYNEEVWAFLLIFY
jgi:hypothetical protein